MQPGGLGTFKITADLYNIGQDRHQTHIIEIVQLPRGINCCSLKRVTTIIRYANAPLITLIAICGMELRYSVSGSSSIFKVLN